MIEQLSESGFTGGGLAVGSVTSNEKQQPAVVKKQALRDLPNENNVTKSTSDSTLPKERITIKDPEKVSGAKRLSSEVNPPLCQVLNAANTNGNLVYVRRKTEAEVGKISSSGTAGNNSIADLLPSVKPPVSNDACNGCPSSEPSTMPVNLQNESQLPNPHPVGKSGNTISALDDKSSHPIGVSGKTVSSVENISPNPRSLGMFGNSAVSTENKSPQHPLGMSGNSNTMSSAEDKSQASHPISENSKVTTGSVEIKSPIPHPVGNSSVVNSSVENRSTIPSLGKLGNIIPSTDNCQNPPVLTTKVDFTKELNNKQLQHRQVQPRISLRGLDRSAHEEYLQMLRSLSSAELSRLAVELETRAIQLSLEEAREIARTEMLNVMGKSSKA